MFIRCLPIIRKRWNGWKCTVYFIFTSLERSLLHVGKALGWQERFRRPHFHFAIGKSIQRKKKNMLEEHFTLLAWIFFFVSSACLLALWIQSSIHHQKVGLVINTNLNCAEKLFAVQMMFYLVCVFGFLLLTRFVPDIRYFDWLYAPSNAPLAKQQQKTEPNRLHTNTNPLSNTSYIWIWKVNSCNFTKSPYIHHIRKRKSIDSTSASHAIS